MPVKAAAAMKRAIIGDASEPEEKAVAPSEPPEPPAAPEETLAPKEAPKRGGIVSGYECQFCGKKYRLERYFLPHTKACTLNPSNIIRQG